MISVKTFVEPVNIGYWDSPPLSGFIYRNVLSERFLTHIKKELNHIINDTGKATFLTNVTILRDGDKEIKLGTNYFNDRYQNVLFDLSYHSEYWYQTVDTIYDWGFKIISKECSPNFLHYLHVFKNLEPFNNKKWLPYRLHINYLPTNEGLGIHVDSNHMMFKEEFDACRQLSLTYYTEDHVANLGGELYTINGFTFKPQKNVAIAMNGHQVPHGVTYNISENSRLAFTTRWAHIDDLFLPGHPDKHLYKMNHL